LIKYIKKKCLVEVGKGADVEKEQVHEKWNHQTK